MIYGMEGKPRSGKSYESVVYHVIPAIDSGRKVITNLPLNLDWFIAIYGAEKVANLIEIRTESIGIPKSKDSSLTKGKPFSSIECYKDDWRNESGQGALFIIDECHFVLPSGRTHIEISEFFSMHGHYGFDFLLITQNFRKVDRDIKDMIELVYYVAKNTMLGSNKTYTKKVKDGLRGDVVNTEQRKYEEKYYPSYKSHTESNTAVVEASANDVKSIWQHWVVKGSAIFLVLAVFMFYKALTSGDKQDIVVKKSEPVSAAAVTVDKSVNLNPPQNLVKESNIVGSSSNVVGERSPVEEIPVEKVKAKIAHPFYKIGFHIGGRYTINDLNGFLIIASQNGQDIFNMRLRDFYMAGYDLTVLGDCLIELSYKDSYHDFVTCDAPRIGITLANQ